MLIRNKTKCFNMNCITYMSYVIHILHDRNHKVMRFHSLFALFGYILNRNCLSTSRMCDICTDVDERCAFFLLHVRTLHVPVPRGHDMQRRE